MKLLTRNTDYGIRAICYMSKHNADMVSAAELAKALEVPGPFLRKILQVLNKEGVVRSRKGLAGGFRLAAKPQDISLIDLIEAFQGKLKINECLFKKSLCPNTRMCTLKNRIDGIEKYVMSELRSISIQDLL